MLSVVLGNSVAASFVGAVVLAIAVPQSVSQSDGAESQSPLPRSVTVSGATWADVQKSQERYAQEFDCLLTRLDPANAQRAAQFTEATDAPLRKAIEAAGLSVGVPPDVLSQRIGDLLRQYPKPNERGQILVERARIETMAGRSEAGCRAIEEALKLPLWPDQRIELYHAAGQLILKDYSVGSDSVRAGAKASFAEMRRRLAVEYLKGVRVALDCAFPRGLPDLQQPNTIERVVLPDDPAQRKAVEAGIEHRKMVQAKASEFLHLFVWTEGVKADMERDIVAYYATAPAAKEELEKLATEILQSPQEVARLLENLDARIGK